MSNLYEMLVVPRNRIKDVEPCDDQLLVRVESVEKKTQGGIILSDSVVSEERKRRIVGKVEAVGPNVDLFKSGDEIVFAQFSGVVIYATTPEDEKTELGFEYRLMSEKSVVARLKAAESK